MGRRTSRRPLTPNTVTFIQETSPLDYRPSGFSKGAVQRIAMVDPDVPEPERGQRYFQPIVREVWVGKSGRRLKRPRKDVTPGAAPGTLAFLDYYVYGEPKNYTVYINYIATREDQRGKGLARELLRSFFDNAAKSGVTHINFGRIMTPAIWKLYEEHRRSYETGKSGVSVSGKRDF